MCVRNASPFINVGMALALTNRLLDSKTSMMDVIFNNTAQCHTSQSAITKEEQRAPALPMKTPRTLTRSDHVWLRALSITMQSRPEACLALVSTILESDLHLQNEPHARLKHCVVKNSLNYRLRS